MTRGSVIADIYAVDFAEVRLPIPPEDLAYVDLPVGYTAPREREDMPPVTLHVEIGGQPLSWPGWIERTEGEIDPRTRLLVAVARVEDPYGFDNPGDGPPLAAGLFVRATIEGRTATGVIRAPRMALRGDRLLVVDSGNRLQLRAFRVLRIEGETAILEGAITPGDRICVSVLESLIEGMEVIPVDARMDDTEVRS